VLVTRDDGIDRRILPGADTVEPEFVALVDERHTHLGCEERGRNLANHPRNIPTGQSKRKVTAFMATIADAHFGGRDNTKSKLRRIQILSCVFERNPAGST
jgi:hypothetical protein